MEQDDKINFIEIPGKASLWSDKDDISWLVFAHDCEISLVDIQEIVVVATRNHKEGDLFKVLADIRGMESISLEARQFASSGRLRDVYNCLAIVASTPATKLVGNFFIRFHKPPRPVRIFDTVADARNWLLSFN